MEEIDLSKEIEKILLNSNRSKEIKSGEEVNKLSKKKFLGVHTHEFGLQNKVFEGIAIENVLMGFSLSGGCVVFSKNKFCISNGMINKYRLFPISQFRKLIIERDGLTSDSVFLNGKRVGNFNRQSIDPWKRICDEINLFLQPYLQIKLKEHEEHEKKWRLHEEEMFFLQKNQELKDQLSKIKSLKLELIEEYDDCKTLINDIKNTQGKKLDLNKIEIKLNEEKRMFDEYVTSRSLNNEPVISDLGLLRDLNTKFKNQKKSIIYLLNQLNHLNNLKQSQTNVLSELDKDGNGEVDVIEGNDFHLLLKKHQKSIVEVDRTYVQQFVKISGYLKTKEKNIQSIFNLIKDTPNQDLLNEYVEVLKDDIHSYNLILFNSLNMIVSLVEDDMITFYEIHEMFDTLNMFDSKHEKDVSQKLTNIGDGLKDLMYEIRRMGDQISDSISELTYVTEQSNEQLTDQLSEINSTLKVGNLISTINTYQNYKNKRRLNS
jgi:hypothetical protein